MATGSGALPAAMTALAAIAVLAAAASASRDPVEAMCPPGLAVPADPSRTYPDGHTWRQGGVTFTCSCGARPCLWMCCPRGEAFNTSTCVPDTSPWPPLVVADENGDPFETEVDSFFTRRFEKICPHGKVMLLPETNPEDNYTLFWNGGLSVAEGQEFADNLSAGEFCAAKLASDPAKIAVLMCVSPSEVHRGMIYSVFMIISLPFLLATFFVYAALPRLQNLHGRCVMSHVAALFVAYIFLICAQLEAGSFSDTACTTTAFIIYFAFLASFFWLNVMCLDIWWTFSGYRPMRGSVKEREHKKFIIYSLYCWGSPLIMLTICMVMDLHPGIPDTVEKPGFGKQKCWFQSTEGNFYYFLGPIAILILCNIVLFVLTSLKIRQVKRGNKILKKQDSRRHHHHDDEENNAQRFNLYLKLFLVMGVNWSMEVISFAAGGPEEWWYVTDIANTLQGVLIFVIFVWKDRIRRLLLERLCPGRAAAHATSASTASSTRMTPMRQGSVLSNSRNSTSLAGNTNAGGKEQHSMITLVPPPSMLSEESDIA